MSLFSKKEIIILAIALVVIFAVKTFLVPDGCYTDNGKKIDNCPTAVVK